MDHLATLLLVMALVTAVGLPLGWLGTRLARTRRPAGPGYRRAGQKAAPAVIIIGPAVPVVVGPAPAVVIGPGKGTPLPAAQPLRVGPAPGACLLVEPAAAVMPQVGPTPAERVVPPARSLWDERGWTRRPHSDGAVYEGHYRVLDRRQGQARRFAGRVVVRHGHIDPYIADPPSAIRHHPKGPCFSRAQAPWFRLHWHRPAANVDDTILYVEKVLDEALRGRP